MKRKSTGKKLRFSVFDRDKYTCQYCGRKTPDVILVIDHIFPVSKGGLTEIDNLITACESCNQGKSDKTIGSTPDGVKKNIADIKEKKKQMEMFYKYQLELEDLNIKILNIFQHTFSKYWDFSLSTKELNTIKALKDKYYLSCDDIIYAINISCTKMRTPYDSIKYMFGIIHKIGKENINIPY